MRAAAVTIVATNRETQEGLRSYLRRAGVSARSTRDLADCARSARDVAVVLFPDDFPREKVVAVLAALPRSVLAVLVTAHPQKFERTSDAERVVIMPRPAWGWSILEAIRAHVAKGPR